MYTWDVGWVHSLDTRAFYLDQFFSEKNEKYMMALRLGNLLIIDPYTERKRRFNYDYTQGFTSEIIWYILIKIYGHNKTIPCSHFFSAFSLS